MARRKKDPFSDDDSSTDDDSFDAADVDGDDLTTASGLGFSARHAHKRPRRTKDDAIYGMFGDGDNKRARRRRRSHRASQDARGKKIDYRRGQAFVPASASAAANSTQGDEAPSMQEAAASGSGGSDSSDSDLDSEAEVQHDAGDVEAGEVDDFQPASFRSSRGGIGTHGHEQTSRPQRPPPTEQPQKRSGRAGIGARAGIGIGSSSSNRDGDDAVSAPRRTGSPHSRCSSRPEHPSHPNQRRQDHHRYLRPSWRPNQTQRHRPRHENHPTRQHSNPMPSQPTTTKSNKCQLPVCRRPSPGPRWRRRRHSSAHASRTHPPCHARASSLVASSTRPPTWRRWAGRAAAWAKLARAS